MYIKKYLQKQLITSIIIIIIIAITVMVSSYAIFRSLTSDIELNNNETFAQLILNNHRGREESNSEIFAITDHYGISFYFRSSDEINNNVIFAGYGWKIIRLDGNENIQMIYNGECLDNNCLINETLAGTGNWSTDAIDVFFNNLSATARLMIIEKSFCTNQNLPIITIPGGLHVIGDGSKTNPYLVGL